MRSKRKTKPAALRRDAAGGDAPAATRLANGRWVDGHCPNRKGRPRKQKPQDPLNRFLDEVLPKGSPGGALTLPEAVLKALCGHAIKDPRIALELMKRGLLLPPADGEAEQSLLPEEDAQLEDFLARQARRRPPSDASEEDAS